MKSERLQRLQDAIKREHFAFNARCVGSTFEVLMEKRGRDPGQLTGRSPYLQPVQVMAGQHLIGAMVPVTITGTIANSLFGALAQDLRIEAESRPAQLPIALGA